jgi:tetratricopeptide (TPR) repeat protein
MSGWKRRLLLAVLFLFVVSCDEKDTTTFQAIKEATGVDVSDPTSVGQYALDPRVQGNQDQTDALINGLTRAARRNDLESEGDRLRTRPENRLDLEKARDKYKEALSQKLADENTSPHALLLAKIANTYGKEAENLAASLPDPTGQNSSAQDDDRRSEAIDRYDQAAKYYKRAADNEPDTARKAAYLAHQAYALYQGSGSSSSACATAREALRLRPGESLATRVAAGACQN